jgi:predicted DCC family thiol-disulfide oxidoreductase YuxK
MLRQSSLSRLQLLRTSRSRPLPPPRRPRSTDWGDEASYSRLAMNVSGGGGGRQEWTPRETMTVYFDAGCPLCRREIALYQRLNSSVKPRPRLSFEDCRLDHPELSRRGISVEDRLRVIHVLSEDDTVIKGVPAFVEMWRRLPYWNALVPLFQLPGVMTIAEKAYSGE